jgi:hypothetical protein
MQPWPAATLSGKGYFGQWQTQRRRESELSGVGHAQRADAIASGTIATSCSFLWTGNSPRRGVDGPVAAARRRCGRGQLRSSGPSTGRHGRSQPRQFPRQKQRHSFPDRNSDCDRARPWAGGPTVWLLERAPRQGKRPQHHRALAINAGAHRCRPETVRPIIEEIETAFAFDH